MVDQLTSVNPLTDRVVVLSVKKTEKVGGGTEAKRRLFGSVFTGGQKTVQEISYVEKSLSPSATEHVLAIWKAAARQSLPVVPELLLSERGTVLGTDMKTPHNEIYGRSTALDHAEILRRKQHGLSMVDVQFIEEYPKIRQLIQQQATDITNTFAQNNILPSYDDPYVLIYDDTQSFSLLMLDLSFAEMGGILIKNENQKAIAAINDTKKRRVATLMKFLDETHKRLVEINLALA